MQKNKLGVGIVTYNSENYFRDLYNTLPLERIDELVVVNGGDKYTKDYKCNKWIQHAENKYPAVCRNECVEYLLQRECEHIFIIEDDMLVKDKSIFDKYIQTSKASGIKYFSFVSTSWETGIPGKREPRLVVDYRDGSSVSLYKNMCNEFTYHHYTAFTKTGLYDSQFRDPFDIDMAYRESQQDYSSPFWWFADITGSDNYIENNPIAVSRLQTERSDGSREQRIQEQWKLFVNKHKLMVHQIKDIGKDEVIKKLKSIKNENKYRD